MRDVGYKKGRLFRQPLSMIYETYALLCYFLQQVRQFKIAFAGSPCGKSDDFNPRPCLYLKPWSNAGHGR